MRGWWLVALCACRFHFDEQARVDDGGIDAIDASTTTITFGERPTSQRQGVTTDVTLDESAPGMNFGGAEDLSLAEFTVSGEHALIRFDLSSIASGTSVTAARLSVVRLDYGDETPGSIEARLVGESWVEGTSAGTPGSGANWTSRDGASMWTTAGGTTTAALAAVTPTAAEITFAFEAAVVQDWVDAPATNFGVLLTVGINTAHYHLHSRNSMLVGMTARPELAVDLSQ
jgi:hypothetical protein